MTSIPKRGLTAPGRGKRTYDSSKMVGKASPRQKELLDKHGLKYKKGLTKAEASDMIQAYIDEKKAEAKKIRQSFKPGTESSDRRSGFSCTHDMPDPEEEYYEDWED